MKNHARIAKTVAGAICISAALASGSIAQNAQPPQSPCQTDENFRAFDFWVGYWEVTPWAGGQVAGHNKIESVENGCAVMESWTNAGGGTGRSVNFYNANTGKWRQLWVSNGYSIDIEGGLKNGAMALEGSIFYYGPKNTVPFKGTWTPQADGSVRQLFEQWNAETNEWTVWFDGKYVRVAEPTE